MWLWKPFKYLYDMCYMSMVQCCGGENEKVRFGASPRAQQETGMLRKGRMRLGPVGSYRKGAGFSPSDFQMDSGREHMICALGCGTPAVAWKAKGRGKPMHKD